jgi:hypothetical protein
MQTFLRNHAWTPVLTSGLLGFVWFFALPVVFLLALNSRSGVLALIALGCVSIPWTLARIHRIPAMALVISFYAVMAAGWFLQPATFDGNQKLGLATYLEPWLVLALMINASLSALLMQRRHISQRPA